MTRSSGSDTLELPTGVRHTTATYCTRLRLIADNSLLHMLVLLHTAPTYFTRLPLIVDNSLLHMLVLLHTTPTYFTRLPLIADNSLLHLLDLLHMLDLTYCICLTYCILAGLERATHCVAALLDLPTTPHRERNLQYADLQGRGRCT